MTCPGEARPCSDLERSALLRPCWEDELITRRRADKMGGRYTLVNLAPDVQEALLFLVPGGPVTDHPTERQLRQVVAQADWQAQRRLWHGLTHQTAAPPPVL